MRQAVRVGRQIRLPLIRSQGKTGMQSVTAVSSTNVWAVGGQRQRLCTLPFSPINLDKGPSTATMDVGVGAFASNWPIAGSQTWTGEPVKLLCRGNLALSTTLFSVMSASKVQL